VVDVPSKLSARVRVLSSFAGNARKNDKLDAFATALWPLGVTSGWQRSIPRLSRRCCASFPRDAKTWWPSVLGHSTASTGFYGTWCRVECPERSLSPEPPASYAAYERRAPRPAFAGGWLRGGAALRLRTLQRKIADLDGRIEDEVEASGSTLTEIFGVGPILAARGS
jgi:transposase